MPGEKPLWTDVAQWITALASLVIAAYSIWLANDVRISDSENRELQIRPAIRMQVSSDPPMITVKNVGLGPAKIVSVRYRADDTDVNDPPTYTADDEEQSLKKIQTKLVSAIVDEAGYRRIDKSLPSLALDVFFPSPGEIIAVGEEIPVLKIVNFTEAEREAGRIGAGGKFESWMSSFGLSPKNSFNVSYCSLTGGFCSTLDHDRPTPTHDPQHRP